MGRVYHFWAKYNALHFALCYRRVCLSVCLSVCVPRLWISEKLLEIVTSFFFKLRENKL